jgi:hypothetical protein
MMRLKQTLNQRKIYSVFEFKHHAAAYSYGSKIGFDRRSNKPERASTVQSIELKSVG